MENIENAGVTAESGAEQTAPYTPAPGPGRPQRSFFDRNRKIITYAGGGLLVLILGVLGYQYWTSSQDGEAQEKLFAPARLWENDSFKMAEKGLQGVVSDYSGTNAANQAHYQLGTIYMQQGKYQQAIDELESFDTKSPIMRPIKLGLIGDAYSQLKDYRKAVDYYEDAAKDNNNQFTTPRYLKKAALVYELELKEYEEAVRLYTEIKQKFRTTMVAQDMEKYINRAQASLDAGK